MANLAPDPERDLTQSFELAEQKAILRGHMREIRSEAAARDPDAAERLAARFPIKLFERYGPVVAGYFPIHDEIDPHPLLVRLRAEGARVVWPRVDSPGVMSFRHVDAETLERGSFGLTQPSAEAPELRPGLILAPLLSFDARGTRLGYGKGHYDKAMAHLRSTGRVFYLGLAYAAQQADVVPAEKHDIPLDWVETPLNSVPLFLGRAMAR
ncbi:MAG: 5-formyltetrahydrofolate cyclo-ligase [Alphaproteobacteria bacterium]|nr:5-formyltetrahydrofolate cyclo-ligase [Alphaproteobacteria bacterium]